MLNKLIKVATHLNLTTRALLCPEPEFLKGNPSLEFMYSIFIIKVD